MNKDEYKKAFGEVKMPDYLEKEILNMTDKNKRRPFYFRPLAVGLTLSLLIACLFSVLVYADVIDLSNIYKFIFGDDTGYIEQHIKPIETTKPDKTQSGEISNDSQTDEKLSAENISNDIKIELISAINNETSLLIFASMTDLSDGDRLSEKTRFDNWILDQGHGGNLRVVEYNEDTKTAILMLTSLGDNHEGRANLTINGFSGGFEFILDKAESEIDFYDLLQDSPPIVSQDEVSVNGGSSSGNGEDDELYKSTKLLGFGDMSVDFNNVNLAVSGVGFVDGCLQVQIKKQYTRPNQIIGIYLADKNNIVYQSYLSLCYTENVRYHGDDFSFISEYRTFIFKDITSPEQLKDLSVSIDYVLEGETSDGQWEFSFDIPEKSSMDIKVEKNLNINGQDIMVDIVSVSPLGVSLKLPSEHLKDYKREDKVSIVYQNDSIELLEISTVGYNEEVVLNFGGSVIEIEKVREVIINGEIIPVMVNEEN